MVEYSGKSYTEPEKENLYFIFLARTCASLGVQQKSNLIVCVFSQFQQPVEDHICNSKSNMVIFFVLWTAVVNNKKCVTV